jgi:hypothetical protein
VERRYLFDGWFDFFAIVHMRVLKNVIGVDIELDALWALPFQIIGVDWTPALVYIPLEASLDGGAALVQRALPPLLPLLHLLHPPTALPPAARQLSPRNALLTVLPIHWVLLIRIDQVLRAHLHLHALTLVLTLNVLSGSENTPIHAGRNIE